MVSYIYSGEVAFLGVYFFRGGYPFFRGGYLFFRGGYLAEINSSDEQAVLDDLLPEVFSHLQDIF